MTTEFTPARISSLREIARDATRRPWRHDISAYGYGQPRIYGDGRLVAVVGNAEPERYEQWCHDAMFATSACNEILPALDEIERLRAENERLREECEITMKTIADNYAEIERLREALEPFARADRAIGDEPGPFRFETGSGYRPVDREDIRRARRALEGGDA